MIDENQQFDFWLGEWDVFSEEKLIASSRIEKIVDGHIILENYEQEGYSGKSINYYDNHLEKWRQNWVDSVGSVGDFTGACKDDIMRFEGESHLKDFIYRRKQH